MPLTSFTSAALSSAMRNRRQLGQAGLHVSRLQQPCYGRTTWSGLLSIPLGCHRSQRSAPASTMSIPFAAAACGVAAFAMGQFGKETACSEFCRVHVWRGDMLLQKQVLHERPPPDELVLTSNKTTLATDNNTEAGNWANQDEAQEPVTKEMFIKLVDACDKDGGFEGKAYIMLHGGKTVKPFLTFISSLVADCPGFHAKLAKIPIALATPCPTEFDQKNILELKSAGLKKVVVVHKGPPTQSGIKHSKSLFMQSPEIYIQSHGN